MCKSIALVIIAAFVFAVATPEFSWAQTNARGSYNTEVPIEVPPFHSITPVVKLVYQSSGGSGLAGAGWDLLAGSVISRRSATNGTPLFAPNDIFVLDGEELVPCKPGSTSPSCTTAVTAFGSSTGFYSTRIESFERIRFESATGTWTIWSRDGIQRTYISGDGGLSYQMRTVADTYNNLVNYAWSCASNGTGPCQLDSISYGANMLISRGGAPGIMIRFYREARPDPRGISTGRGRVWLGERLRSIVVYSHGQLLRAYRLTYETSLVSGASILTSVQQYGKGNTVDATGQISPGSALPPITFSTNSLSSSSAWKLNAETIPINSLNVGIGAALNPVYGLPTELTVSCGYNYKGDDVDMPSGTVVGDFDGDGRAEVMAWGLTLTIDNRLGVGTRRVMLNLSGYLSSPVGIGPAVSGALDTGIIIRNLDTQKVIARAFTADRNGDLNDNVVLAINVVTSNTTVANGNLVTAVYSANPTNSMTGGFISGGRQTNVWIGDNRNCVVADVTGDGRDDLICEDPKAKVIRIYPAGGATTEVPTNLSSVPSLPNHDKLRIAAGDVDGNGLADIVLVIPSGTETRVILGRSIGRGAYDWSEEQRFPVNMSRDNEDTFHLTDLDGDGRLDLAFARELSDSTPSPGQFIKYTHIFYALSRKGYGGVRWRWQQPRLESGLIRVSFVDLDGDGRADLFGEDGRPDLRGNWLVQLANPMGGFQPANSVQINSNGDPLMAADLNGDGLADPMCIQKMTADYPNSAKFSVTDRPTLSQGNDRHRWRRADLDGDGKHELVYIAFNNPGYKINVVSPQTQSKSLFTLSTGPQTGPLVEPDASRWIFADVGSPAGPADGKEDLVLVELSGSALKVTTLLSTGLGTFTVYQQTVTPNYLDRSTLGWFSAQLDRDGRSELVHLRPSYPGGVVVDVLRATGPGQWTITSQTYFANGAGKMTDHSVRRFLPTDINRDRLTDLVHVDTGINLIRTLRADGQGGFTEVVSAIPGVSARAPVWRLGDLDGDGVPDLVFISHTVPGSSVCLTISQLTGDGLGGFLPSSAASIGGDVCVDSGNQFYTRLFEDTSNIVLIDLDGDGDDDLVHASHAIDANGELRLVVTRISYNPNGATPALRWTASPEAIPTAYEDGESWGWGEYRDPVSGAAGLAHINSELALTLTWRGPTDELTAIKNGIGLTTKIEYAPYLNSRAYLPAGYVPKVVSRITTVDEAYPIPIQDIVEYGYNDAHWSDHDGALAGFEVKVANDSRARYYSRFAIDDTCGARVTQTETRTPNGGDRWGLASIHYPPAGTEAPFRCQPDVTERNECEPGQSCRMAERVEQDYDAYGNVIDERTFVDKAAPTRSSTTVKVNPTAYIIDRASTRTTVGLVGSTWKPMAMRFFYYDGQSDFRLPPGAHGALTKVADPDDQSRTNKITSYTYAANGILTQTVTPGGKTSTVTPDSIYGRFPELLCDAINNCVRQEWDLVLGKVTRLTDAAGGVRLTQYDEFGRVKQVDHPGGGFTRTSYLDNGVFRVTRRNPDLQRVRTEISDGSPGDGVLWSESFFDGSGRTYRTTREGGATVTTTYADASARPAAVSLVHDASVAPTQWTQFTYDGLGRVVSMKHPDGTNTGTTYSLSQVETRDELGKPTLRRLDGTGRVIELVEPTQALTKYTYDPLGRLETITNALGNQDILAWSTLGRRTASTDPDRGKRGFSYYDDGELQEQVDAKGQKIAWTYDTIGRAILREDRDTTGRVTRTIRWTYDNGAAPHGSSRGRLVRVDDSQPDTSTTFSREFWYDAGGRVTTERTCIDGTCMNQDAEYDMAGRVSAHIYPDASGNTQAAGAERLTYGYDNAGRLSTVGNYASLGWELDDRMRIIDYHNGVNTVYSYDPNRRWLDNIRIQNLRGSQSQLIEYRHDPVGRITDQVATGLQTVTLGYTYDNLGRLTKTQSSDPTRNEEFHYDEIGRMKYSSALSDVHYDDPAHIHAATKTDRGYKRSYDVNGNAQTLSDPGGRNLVLDWTVDDRIKQVRHNVGNSAQCSYGPDTCLPGYVWREAYSGDHVCVTGATRTQAAADNAQAAARRNPQGANGADTCQQGYVWREATSSDRVCVLPSVRAQTAQDNQLAASRRNSNCQAYTFGYDPDGQRVKKTGPSGTLKLFGSRLALDEQGRMVKYYMAGSLLLARTDSATSYFHTDVSNATRLITDQNGQKIADYQYTAFGEPISSGAMPDNEIGFSAARRDTELGLVAMGARIYDPVLGQFLSADSYIPDAYRPQSLNRYSYVENDPVNHWDPSGHSKLQVEYRKLRQKEDDWVGWERRMREADVRLFGYFGEYLNHWGGQPALWYGYNKEKRFVLYTIDPNLLFLLKPPKPPGSDSVAKSEKAKAESLVKPGETMVGGKVYKKSQVFAAAPSSSTQSQTATDAVYVMADNDPEANNKKEEGVLDSLGHFFGHFIRHITAEKTLPPVVRETSQAASPEGAEAQRKAVDILQAKTAMDVYNKTGNVDEYTRIKNLSTAEFLKEFAPNWNK